jgi:hypothetical protein
MPSKSSSLTFKDLLINVANDKETFKFSWDKKEPFDCIILRIDVPSKMVFVKLSKPIKEQQYNTKDTPFGELSGYEEVDVYEKWVKLK